MISQKKLQTSPTQQVIEELEVDDGNTDGKSASSTVIRFPQHRDKQEDMHASDTQPYEQGEQSVSGSSPEADDDTLANAQAVGMQLGEDEEHPQELDIARDVDAAEQSLRDH